MIRVLLADDQAMVRGALAALLNLEKDMDVVAQVGRGDEVLRAVEKYQPDIAVVDIEMPGLDGIEATAQITQGGFPTRVLIVTTFGRPGYLKRALDAGASGFIVKETPADELAKAVRTVHAGGRVVDPALATTALFEGNNPLTDRERELLRIALEGVTVADIAAEVFLSEGTVRNLLSSAIAKTGARTRNEAARIAQENGWL
ncbi:MAG: response regulator transcription factor [Actinomycetaceae bacterium]|nr:response regulator transcription factor [Actinomycetaceae bacterium]